MEQYGKKHQCRNCEWFKPPEIGNWKLMQWYYQQAQWCTAPGYVHRVPHTKCRCRNGQFKLCDGSDSYENKMMRITSIL